MAFCTGCGADVTGRNFCVQWGKPVGAAQPAAAPQQPVQGGPSTPPAYSQPAAYNQPPAYNPQQGYGQSAGYGAQPAGAPIPAKKTSPIVWIIVGVLGFFVLV